LAGQRDIEWDPHRGRILAPRLPRRSVRRRELAY
jgi:hypothetical protein